VANSYDVMDLTSHGRGRWFEPSIAHSGIACKTRYSDVRWLCGDCWCAATRSLNLPGGGARSGHSTMAVGSPSPA
jgi:hypothetical protein